ncbi:innexin Vnx-b7 [Ichnoviriform fugitivi]|uniref:Innexin Vnx-b7 n=1 Tax=Ichnoviriform fugitivi TaxID=265522 RepID=Q6Q2L1_9VIRU|nr:innexin Vnx-b7 [Ichnoviriform fugitivi]AAS79819.1 innexin Vnx-b7 [Ichnoviriform fugitivi]
MSVALKALRGLLKVQAVNIDTNVFRLHYKLTVIVLLVLWLLITSRQFFGNYMECYFPDYPTISLNTYCYIHSTFLVKPSEKNPARQSLPHPGVSGQREGDTLKFYSYYQWLFVVLFVQAVFFYLPHHVWKVWEGGLMKTLAVDLTSPVVSADRIKKNTDVLLEYFQTQLHSHNSYALKYFSCELFNLINIISQILFMNAFLGEDFHYYGIYVLIVHWKEGLQPEMTKPMELLFPTVTKCTFKKYGPSGSAELRDGMCILTQNALNQKIFVFLWFWFHILAAMSAFVIVCRIFTLVFPSLRLRSFRSTCSLNSARDINVVFDKLWIGDWFLLCMLQRNINILAYKELIIRIARSCDSNICSECSEGMSRPCVQCTQV